jgi:D-alanyl-D-alanine carboxypeptidase (penicillin-binding protein 5/6)
MTSNDPPHEPVLTRRALRRHETGATPVAAETTGAATPAPVSAPVSPEPAADAAVPAATTVAAPRRRRGTAAKPEATAAAAAPADGAAAEAPAVEATPAEAPPVEATPAVATVPTTTRALTWIREDGTSAVPQPEIAPDAELVDRWPRRSPLRPGVLIPLGSVLGLVAVYVIAMLIWPLYAVAPRVESVALQTAAGAPASIAWPGEGSAALAVEGIGTTAASADAAVPMASITKVITALVVLDALPLAVGETGPEYAFTRADRTAYRNTLAADESALDVPVGGTLTEYQLLEGMLIGSAGNYADKLVDGLYPSDAVYARAAMQWLAQHGLAGITVVDSSGISPRNTATPAALVGLARRALANPVIAEIVAKESVELPGAGVVENTNALLGEPGIVGVKTGLLFGEYNVLAARDITVGETTVRAYASVLGQPDSETRFAVARDLLNGLDAQLAPTLALPAGSVVGTVSTLWADPVDIVTATDGSVILWNGSASSGTADLSLGDDRESGASAGSVTITGPVDDATVEAVLADAVEGPSLWWRITHPLQLFGLVAG